MENDKKDQALVMPVPAEAGGARQNTELKLFLIDSLRDIYWAEKALVKELPRMHNAANTSELKAAFGEHFAQTEIHVKRLEQVFGLCGMEPEEKKCDAMQGLLSECNYIIAATTAGSMTREAALILAAQKIEHYEIATYGALLEFARVLGMNEVAGLLHATLDEEKHADQLLTLLARTGINWYAEHETVVEP